MKAKAATPGPWDNDHLCVDMPSCGRIPARAFAVDTGESNDNQSALDAEFIAAANPATVLALIAEVRQLRAQEKTVAQVIAQGEVTLIIPPTTITSEEQHQLIKNAFDLGMYTASNMPCRYCKTRILK